MTRSETLLALIELAPELSWVIDEDGDIASAAFDGQGRSAALYLLFGDDAPASLSYVLQTPRQVFRYEVEIPEVDFLPELARAVADLRYTVLWRLSWPWPPATRGAA